MSTLPVFLSTGLPTPGATVVLDGPEGRHAATVRRMRAGEQLMLCDGAGGLARCEVVAAHRDFVELRVLLRRREPAPALRVTLAQALLKGDRGELAVELATEAGVDAVLPWQAERAIARWDAGPRGAKALERWRETARQAAKQARRAVVPDVATVVRTAELADRCLGATVTLVLHESAVESLPSVTLPAAGDVLLVVGPEGGITDAELAVLTAAGARSVRLGPQVLRASTAGAVALAVVGALSSRWAVSPSGDLDQKPPPDVLV